MEAITEATVEASMVEAIMAEAIMVAAGPLAMEMEDSTAYRVSSASTSTKQKPFDWLME